jgi:hypothetical protein
VRGANTARGLAVLSPLSVLRSRPKARASRGRVGVPSSRIATRTDEASWPQDRDVAMFTDRFKIILLAMVADVGEGQIGEEGAG